MIVQTAVRNNNDTRPVYFLAQVIHWKQIEAGNLPTWLFYIYRPQRSCDKVMFLHRSVILSTGGVSQHALRQTPPGRHPARQTHPGQAHTPPGQTPPPQETATAADGTHRTGMHSCLTSDHFPLGGAEFDPVVLCANKLFNVYHK